MKSSSIGTAVAGVPAAYTSVMNWREQIETNPQILGGRPVVRGTRLSVEFLLGLMGQGWTETQVLESYPNLRPEQLRAVFAFAADSIKDEDYDIVRVA